jgi:hypothetical protein
MLRKTRILLAMLSVAKVPAAIAVLSGFSVANAHAGVLLAATSTHGIQISTPSSIVVAPAVPAPNQHRLPGQTLRCWNNGRLVYEAGGFRGTMSTETVSSVEVPRAAEGHPVTVFDMKDGMCILSAF